MDQADENAPESMHERYDEERARRRQAQDRRIQELRQPWNRAVQSGVAATPPPAVTTFPRLQVVGAPPPLAPTASYNDQGHTEDQQEGGSDPTQASEAADPSQETSTEEGRGC
ncbi:hypothetical protein PHYSODRAFT_295745 [Phytophthora sojae]|uniref:Uncharacterized protein n=1 Tax=Phytophthora sojae (strain P6497) TaxID=1094619 RepID=G4YZ04_PHYSP|nr:hypothetical protein PHYSODRAFT_295745 [Phytophthora sojae]EGZ23285.1 hypothetical protein PHYSODRAFT_295745 [Phytophthora sojae]|eukprot:XP_009518573.1 hypothetical protein PHYSODRAFT_295745 [Phytophthora sojae]